MAIVMLIPYKGGGFRVSQPFETGKHNGMDLVGTSSKTLVALSDGVVMQSRIVTDKNNLTWQWGNYVTIKDKNGNLITYAHLSKRLVSKGQNVKAGDEIGIEGNTGYSFGSHCHLEVRNASNITIASVNTPSYTGIPNKIITINPSEEKEDKMTAAERKELEDLKNTVSAMSTALSSVEKQLADYKSSNRVWHYWDEIKKDAPWAYPALMALYKKGYFAGSSASNLMLSQEKLENLVVIANILKKNNQLDY